MNKLSLSLIVLALTFALPSIAQTEKEAAKAQLKAEKKAAKEKQRKEKPAYVWNWDGTLSGNQTFDDYLRTVTDIWNEIVQYEQEFGCYNYVQDTLHHEGKFYIMAYMEDTVGNLITRNQSNWQIANSVMAGMNIVLSATNASLSTANATLALTDMGLAAIAFTPYIKGGPMVIAKGMKEMKAITKINKTISRQWKAAKNGAIDPATLGLFSEAEVKKMNKCCYFKEIVETDPMYTVLVTRYETKTPEELAAETAAMSSEWESKNEIPETKSMSDHEFGDYGDDEDEWE
jgi:hypothetical protein